jgi:hypothetical protein
MTWTAKGPFLTWRSPKAKKWGDVVNRYVVYQFDKGEKINLDDPSKIKMITYGTNYPLPYVMGKNKVTYVVTALDRVGNESKGAKKKLKL